MKISIKLPFTEKFLWELYNFIEKIDSWGPSFPLSMKEAVYPDLKQARRIYNKNHNRWLFKNFLKYLKKKGYIRIKEIENKKAIIFTPRGMVKLKKIALKIKTNKKRRDGKWQMVIFDIPEKKRVLRDKLRDGLKTLGYQKFQKSIWISPADVLEETQNLIKNLFLEKYVRLLLVEEVVLNQ